MTHVLIMAAGASTRFGTNKLMCELGGIPVLAHTLAAFAYHDAVDHISIVTNQNNMLYAYDVVKAHRIPKVASIVPGGDTRTQSVAHGLAALRAAEADVVLITDAARPAVTTDDIYDVIEAAEAYGAAALGTPIHDTVVRTREAYVDGYVNRDGLWRVLTPQAYTYDVLRRAYRDAVDATDDSAVVKAAGYDVVMVPGSPLNIKLTYPSDAALLEVILATTHL